jgi:hypothetical protein
MRSGPAAGVKDGPSKSPPSTTKCCAASAPRCATASSIVPNSIRPTPPTPLPIAPLPSRARSRASPAQERRPPAAARSGQASRRSPSSAPTPGPAVTGGGGSSWTAQAFEPVSTLTGIANLLGPNVHVLYAAACRRHRDVFRAPAGRAASGGHLSSKDFTGHAGNHTRSNALDDRQQAMSMGPERDNRRAASATPQATRPPRPANT